MGKKVSEKKELTDKQKKIEAILEKLRNLQGLFVQRDNIERELGELPAKLMTGKEVLARMKKKLDEMTEVLQKQELKAKDLRYQLHDAEEKRLHYEKSMEEAKTQKEYEVLDKAIKEAVLEEQQLRKDLIKEDKETAEQTVAVNSQQQLIDGKVEEIRQEEEKTQSTCDVKKQELEAIQAKIQKVLEKENKNGAFTIDEELLFKFERIIKSRGGKGIVSVGVLEDKDKKDKDEASGDGKAKEKIKAFTCSECHMVLPNQFVNDVHRMDSIMFCPYCSRILFFDEKNDDLFSNADISEGGSFGVFADSDDDDDINTIDDYGDNDEIAGSESDDESAVFGDDDEAVFDEENAEEESELLSEEAAEFGENPEEYDEDSEEEDEEEEDEDSEDEDEDPDADYGDDEDDDEDDE